MDAGEDFKFYFRLWRDCRCAKRPEIFFLHRRGHHSQGPRSATGIDWTRSVTAQWRAELQGERVFTEVREAPDRAPAQMRLTNPEDLIQAHHGSGVFFEAEPLSRLPGLLRAPAPRILEVGANIGNHLVWYARNLAPRVIYPVEPTPEAVALLRDNIAANDLAALVDPRGLGLGAGAAPGRFRTEQPEADNLGATRLAPDASGEIEVTTLDTLMGADVVDMIKIDVEGMELEVLAGAEGVIARDRPLIWIEVRRANVMDFVQGWCRRAGYRVQDSQQNVNAVDYFAVPKEHV